MKSKVRIIESLEKVHLAIILEDQSEKKRYDGLKSAFKIRK